MENEGRVLGKREEKCLSKVFPQKLAGKNPWDSKENGSFPQGFPQPVENSAGKVGEKQLWKTFPAQVENSVASVDGKPEAVHFYNLAKRA